MAKLWMSLKNKTNGMRKMSQCYSCLWYQNNYCEKFNTKKGRVSFCMQYLPKKGTK